MGRKAFTVWLRVDGFTEDNFSMEGVWGQEVGWGEGGWGAGG